MSNEELSHKYHRLQVHHLSYYDTSLFLSSTTPAIIDIKFVTSNYSDMSKQVRVSHVNNIVMRDTQFIKDYPFNHDVARFKTYTYLSGDRSYSNGFTEGYPKEAFDEAFKTLSDNIDVILKTQKDDRALRRLRKHSRPLDYSAKQKFKQEFKVLDSTVKACKENIKAMLLTLFD